MTDHDARAKTDWQIVRLLSLWHRNRRRYWTDKRVRDLGYTIRRRHLDRAVRSCGGDGCAL